jgi:hypothetical protein
MNITQGEETTWDKDDVPVNITTIEFGAADTLDVKLGFNGVDNRDCNHCCEL